MSHGPDSPSSGSPGGSFMEVEPVHRVVLAAELHRSTRVPLARGSSEPSWCCFWGLSGRTRGLLRLGAFRYTAYRLSSFATTSRPKRPERADDVQSDARRVVFDDGRVPTGMRPYCHRRVLVGERVCAYSSLGDRGLGPVWLKSPLQPRV
jgi:hypothetical protein